MGEVQSDNRCQPGRRTVLRDSDASARSKAIRYASRRGGEQAPKTKQQGVAAALLFAIETAMRCGEICKLKRRTSAVGWHMSSAQRMVRTDWPHCRSARRKYGRWYRWFWCFACERSRPFPLSAG